MYVWLLVTKDKYELPLMVTDTAEEMAERLGIGVGTIETTISKAKHGILKHSRFAKVRIDEDFDDVG